ERVSAGVGRHSGLTKTRHWWCGLLAEEGRPDDFRGSDPFFALHGNPVPLTYSLEAVAKKGTVPFTAFRPIGPYATLRQRGPSSLRPLKGSRHARGNRWVEGR